MYTTLQPDVFKIIVKTLERFELKYYKEWRVTKIPLVDQLLMTLIKLKLNVPNMDLAIRFGISETTVHNIFYTLVCALHELLYVGCITIPSQAKCKGSLPLAFEDFGSARLVIDATELTLDIPSDITKQAAFYSSYKSRHTVKSVTGVAPNAALVYASDLYPGSTSDVKIIEHCGLLQHLHPGDLILADKVFTIHSQLPEGVSLNIPPFLSGKSQFTPEEAALCRKIARARIHVERANERIKNFKILDHISNKYRSISSKLFQVCCALTNLQAPLIKEISDNYQFNFQDNN